jgi:hypothetical protein
MPRTEKSTCVVIRPDNTVMQFSAIQWFDDYRQAERFIGDATDLGIMPCERYDAAYDARVAPYYEPEPSPHAPGPVCRECGELREDCKCV